MALCLNNYKALDANSCYGFFCLACAASLNKKTLHFALLSKWYVIPPPKIGKFPHRKTSSVYLYFEPQIPNWERKVREPKPTLVNSPYSLPVNRNPVVRQS